MAAAFSISWYKFFISPLNERESGEMNIWTVTYILCELKAQRDLLRELHKWLCVPNSSSREHTKDVELRVQNGIIESWLMNKDGASTLMNNLSRATTLPSNSFYFLDFAKDWMITAKQLAINGGQAWNKIISMLHGLAFRSSVPFSFSFSLSFNLCAIST